ncbi:MSMEG_0565 family glycosyltransferase [Pseudanabaena mucicola]|uniref:MSMEG_0565 family glycosyltransferase n=1 Tax=Pseudanabaena mucicola FACHB-723 TaxID=2692860 RepID=A0ABR8A2D7_9CYAN|nr:MSMEG_0565 family glycosyltransferase [Pseudanabaena mucicola]MBD2189885.1 MSMEG_0565 family glycosyltransferase [Pseudanabaena mucicola FACHB-723]
MNQSLRIALFTYSTKPRGSVIHTLELAEALQALGHKVCIFALDKDGAGFDRHLSCEFLPIPARDAPKEIDLLIKQRIQEFANYLIDNLQNPQLDYDIYHAQDCISANALAIVRSQQIISHFIRTIHHIEDYNSPYLRDCQDRSIREASLCLCVSDSWQQQIQKDYQIHAPRVINGINVSRFSDRKDGSEQSLKERFGLTGSPIYLTVGGIEPRKNSVNLLKAFSQVLTDFPNAQLAIAGGSTLFDYQDYRDNFLNTAQELGIDIGKSVVITGVLSNVEICTIYRCADVFVFPSIKEGWGLVIFEAIASGLPIITSNILPFTEFLTSTQALLVDPATVEAIAQAMRSINNSDFTNSLIHASRCILTDYLWEQSAKMHLHEYQKLLL